MSATMPPSDEAVVLERLYPVESGMFRVLRNGAEPGSYGLQYIALPAPAYARLVRERDAAERNAEGLAATLREIGAVVGFRVAPDTPLDAAKRLVREVEASKAEVERLREALVSCEQHLGLALDLWSPVRGSGEDDDLILNSMNAAMDKARTALSRAPGAA